MTPSRSPEIRPRAGLRLRLWIGALGGAAVFAAAVWVTIQLAQTGRFDFTAFTNGLALAAGIGLLVSLVLAVWLDRGVVRRVRRLVERTTESDVARRPLEELTGWGELEDASSQLEALIARSRHSARAQEQIETLERHVDLLRMSVEHWNLTERWAPPLSGGPAQPLVEALGAGLSRAAEIREQDHEAARQVRADLLSALEEARDASAQAERGFVEATALLTSIRELTRMGNGSEKAPAPDESRLREAWLSAAADAIEDLVHSAGQSVDQIAEGLVEVQQIGEQVTVLSNRATLIALQAVMAVRQEGGDTSAAELKQLAREARAATDRVHGLLQDLERRVQSAGDHMKGARERVVERLQSPLSVPTASPSTPEPSRRVERLRETLSAAGEQAEKLAASGERASRAAERLVRRIEEQTRDLEGLVARLEPPVEPHPPTSSSRGEHS
jgi:hypothetical protein